MPIVGIFNFSVIKEANFSGIHSRTIAKTPASSSNKASSTILFASSKILP